MTSVSKNILDPDLTDLFHTIQEQRQQLPSTDEELNFLSNLLQSKELNALVNVHNKILSNADRRQRLFPIPVLSDSMQVLQDVLEVLFSKGEEMSEWCKELFLLLQRPHLQGLLCSHDSVAQKDYYPHLPDIPQDEVDETEETIKIVQLVKSNEPLGATIKTDDNTGKIIIARVMHGGAADRSGLIHVGDEVVEVNGINVEGKSPNDVLTILQNSEGTITFKLVPAESKINARESKVRVRVHFDYNPLDDQFIPCKEAGLDFVKGDVLHIVCQDDQYWWQARKEGDKNMRAGLIPSRALQEKKIVHARSQSNNTENHEVFGISKLTGIAGCGGGSFGNADEDALTCSPKSPKCLMIDYDKYNTKTIIYDTAENDDFDREQIATYEEVAKLYPRQGVYRPIVLIGAPGVGRNELKRRLIDMDPDKYRSPTPFTSRPMRPGEIYGKEYYFTTRQAMEEDIEKGNFIEFGEYKGNLYGTSTESIKAIINAGQMCVLDPHYQALKMLRTPQLRPYVIFVKPPSLEKLKETRGAMRARSTFDVNNSRGFTEQEFHDMIKNSERIEFLYEHFFDEIIVNDDLTLAFSKLLGAVHRVEKDPLWVPTNWVQ